MGAATTSCPPQAVDAETFGKKLRQLRTEKGLTRKQLGALSGINWRTIEGWEQIRGSEPLASVIPKLAAALGVSIETMYEDPAPQRGRSSTTPPEPKRRRKRSDD